MYNGKGKKFLLKCSDENFRFEGKHTIRLTAMLSLYVMS